MAVCWLLYRVTVSCFSNQYLHGCIRETRKHNKINSCSGNTTTAAVRRTIVIFSWRWWVLLLYLNSLCHLHPFSRHLLKFKLASRMLRLASWNIHGNFQNLDCTPEVLDQHKTLGIKQTNHPPPPFLLMSDLKKYKNTTPWSILKWIKHLKSCFKAISACFLVILRML